MSIGCMFGFKHVCKNARDITVCLKKMLVLRSTHLDRWQSTLAWLRATDGSWLTLPRKEPKKNVCFPKIVEFWTGVVCSYGKGNNSI